MDNPDKQRMIENLSNMAWWNSGEAIYASFPEWVSDEIDQEIMPFLNELGMENVIDSQAERALVSEELEKIGNSGSEVTVVGDNILMVEGRKNLQILADAGVKFPAYEEYHSKEVLESKWQDTVSGGDNSASLML